MMSAMFSPDSELRLGAFDMGRQQPFWTIPRPALRPGSYVALDRIAGEEQDARHGRLIQIKDANANRA
jgi:hypothetical protein